MGIIKYEKFRGGDLLFSPHTTECFVHGGGGDKYATFEKMRFDPDDVNFEGVGQFEPRRLHIGHFALHAPYIGKGKGKGVLQGFACIVKEKLPSVNTITFGLGTYPSESDIVKVANARAYLLISIGAIEVYMCKPCQNSNDIVVNGIWNKGDWL